MAGGDTLENLKKGAGTVLANILDLIKKVTKLAMSVAGKLIKKLIICHIILFIIWIITAVTMYDKIGTCYEADEFVSSSMTIPSFHDKTEPYKHEDFSHILNDQSDKKIKGYTFLLTGEPITIRIKGEWSPWHGEYDGDVRIQNRIINNDISKELFYCGLNKVSLNDYGFKYSYMSEKYDENVFYYIDNYYSSVTPIKENGKIKYRYVERAPENQKSCWITRGAGLYLGTFGVSGKNQPTEYHQIIGQTMNCPLTSWFNGKDFGSPLLKDEWKKYLKDDGGYTDKDWERQEYTYNDFIEDNFGLLHFLQDKGILGELSNEDREKAKDIIVNDGYKMVYNIELHENLLNKYSRKKLKVNGIEDIGKKVSNAMANFNNACFYKKKGSTGEIITVRNNAYFTFGPKELRRHYTDYSEKYKYGEEVGFFILDKNYNDNIGDYTIDIISGIQYDTTGTLQDLLKKVEFKLLGTPKPNSDNDRADGFLARIYLNILNSDFANVFRTVLVLFVLIYGYRLLIGLTESGDKQLGLLKYKELIPYVIKCALIMTLTSENGFVFFNKTFINFIVNGTIGAIDLVRSIYASSFDTTENLFFLTGGLENASQVLTLSRNFAIIDEILAMLKSEVLLVKILSLYFTGDFLFSAIGTVLMLYSIFAYIVSLLSCLIPYIFILLQWAVVLPLAPIMLVFSLFKNTKKRFDSWLKFCVGKALELFVFFATFYLWTGIINNQVKSILAYKVCVKRLSEFLFSGYGWTSTISVVTIGLVTTVVIALISKYSGSKPSISTIITYAIVMFVMFAVMTLSYFIVYFEKQGGASAGNNSVLGISTSKNFYKDYVDFSTGTGLVFSLIVLLMEVKLFETMIKEIGGVFSKIFTIDGASASNKIASEIASGEKNSIVNFAENMGLKDLQGTDAMKWSKDIMDLSAEGGGIMGNVERLAENNPITKAAGIQIDRLGDGISSAVDTMFDRATNKLRGKKNKEGGFWKNIGKSFMEGADATDKDGKGGSFSKRFMEYFDDSEIGKASKGLAELGANLTNNISNGRLNPDFGLEKANRWLYDKGEINDKKKFNEERWDERYGAGKIFDETTNDKRRAKLNGIFNNLADKLRTMKDKNGILSDEEYNNYAMEFLKERGINIKDGKTLTGDDLNRLFINGYKEEDGKIYADGPMLDDDIMFELDNSFDLGGENATELSSADTTTLSSGNSTELSSGNSVDLTNEDSTVITSNEKKIEDSNNKNDKLEQFKQNANNNSRNKKQNKENPTENENTDKNDK